MLSKEKRINKGKDYNNIFHYGKKIPGRYIIVFIQENNLGRNRCGIVTSKKVGNAVIRNRAKRQLRAIISNGWETINDGYDIVIVARKNITTAVFNQLVRDFYMVMRKAGLC
ncbi:MAG: ribonuclease P protein component [Syntrophomonadaceae bacterium]|jgi:ribonuclease P protein component